MSNLIRWEPMREMMTLREAMDRLFDDAFTRPVNTNNWGAPAIDLYQTTTTWLSRLLCLASRPMTCRFPLLAMC